MGSTIRQVKLKNIEGILLADNQIAERLKKNPGLMQGFFHEVDFIKKEKLANHKAILDSMEIVKLDGLGKLDISGNVIPSVGVRTPASDRNNRIIKQMKDKTQMFNSATKGTIQPGSNQVSMMNFGGNATLLDAIPFQNKKLPDAALAPFKNNLKENLILKNIQGMQMDRGIIDKSILQNTSQNILGNTILNQNVIYSLETSQLEYPIDRAYWVAEWIDLKDNANIIIKNNVKDLVLIAEKITIGKDVTFTWERPQIDKPSSYSVKPPPPKAAQSTTSVGINGKNGDRGLNGKTGFRGNSAPELEFWVLEMVGTPIIDLRGQPGGEGGDGQQGQMGGEGGRGRPANTRGRAGLGCSVYPGAGGHGGDGGDSGDGGTGGDGGHGGRFSFYGPRSLIDAYIERFYINVSGGAGGRGGVSRAPGAGGAGGEVGKTAKNYLFVCSPQKGVTKGKPGKQGDQGNRGKDGEEGQFFTDAITIQAISESEFIGKREMKTAIIEYLDPTYANCGENVTIHGKNFTKDDVVLVDGIRAQSTVYSNNRLIFTVPNVKGGNQSVKIRQMVKGNHGATEEVNSNKGTVYVKPKLTSVSKTRVKPGENIRLKGSGFSPSMLVYVNEQELETIRYINSTEIECKIIRPVDVEANPGGEHVTIKALLADGTDSNEMEIVLETFQMFVFGDSIQWGQGLKEQDKFHSIVSDMLEEDNKGMGFYKTVLAHSGAVIGANIQSTRNPVHGEVPDSYPTVLQQVDAVEDPTEHADLVLLDGGFNDVEIGNVLDPLGPDLAPKGEKYFYKDMKKLLEKVTQKFPRAKIVVTGYYQPISNDSNRLYIAGLLSGLGIALGPLGFTVGQAIGLTSFQIMINRSKEINDLAKTYLRRAVDEINQTPAGNHRVKFAHPNFGPENAVFASNPYLFGLGLDLYPQDEDVRGGRKIECTRARLTGMEWERCLRASAGHPNKKGAQAYAVAIKSVL